MSIFNKDESPAAAAARKNAAIASPTSPDADRTPYEGTHLADQIQIPTMAPESSPMSQFGSSLLPASPILPAALTPRPIGTSAQEGEPKPIGA